MLKRSALRCTTSALAAIVLLSGCAERGTSPLASDDPGKLRYSVSGAPANGENIQVSGQPAVFLAFNNVLYEYPDQATLDACTGNRRSVVRQVSQLPAWTRQALPSAQTYPWLNGAAPVKSPEDGTIYIVPGCVRSGIPDPATYQALFGDQDWGRVVSVPDAVLKSLPGGPVARPYRLKGAGTLIIGTGPEVRWVTYHGGSLAIPSGAVMASHCRSSAEVLGVTDAEFTFHASQAVLHTATSSCGSAVSFDYPVGAPDGTGWLNNRNGLWWLELYNYGGTCGLVYHPGVDLNKDGTYGDQDRGEPVYAVADGVVAASGVYGGTWGNVILVEHTLPDGSKVWSQYGHLETRLVGTGARVARRQQIGTVGKGDGSLSAHLHFEIRKVSLTANAFPCGQSQSYVTARYNDPIAFLNSR
jgi:hypothetical protein